MFEWQWIADTKEGKLRGYCETEAEAIETAKGLVSMGVSNYVVIGDSSASYGWVDSEGYHSEW